jgi:DNA replicative helicase MCM subunit Mcm2 (Cdc46/Mcm family)
MKELSISIKNLFKPFISVSVMATKIKEAQDRLFKNMFVCQRCETKMRADPQKILKGKIKCRKCGRSQFRVLKRK